MNTFLGHLAVLSAFVLLAAPSLAWYARDRRVDRQLRAAAAGKPPGPQGERQPVHRRHFEHAA
ncbi:hypothetical protein [Streptomyces sp. GC420]|uniref:hypothetical protein n=1 Tax=Streptomyces sp. GC420 TaxID=2697568 RepID=UPI0014152A69|nr:hypothetical protein [Streptomyces sp. GC420]NBM15372.1 hypothetical protein [Streptomyces sp. GC420]